MTYFSGCSNSVMLTSTIFIFLLMILIFPQTAEGYNPILKFSSREELVQLAGYGEEKLSTVLITGSVLCQACLHGDTQVRTWPIPGALVTINCHMKGKGSKTSCAKVATDEYGDFEIDLPSHLHAIPNLERTCSVKVVRIPKNSACRPAFARKHKALASSSVGTGLRVYTAGDIKFLHSKSRPLRVCTKGQLIE